MCSLIRFWLCSNLSKEIYFLVYKMRLFPVYSDSRWNGFSKTEELGKQLPSNIMYIHSIFFKRNFMRAKPLILAKERKIKNKAKNKVRHAEHNSKVLRLAILKIIRAKHQNRAWLSLILYCMHTSLLSLFYCHTLT